MAAIADVLPPDRSRDRPWCARSAWSIERCSAPLYGRWRRRAARGSRAGPHAPPPAAAARSSASATCRSAAAARRRVAALWPGCCSDAASGPAILSRGYARRERLDGVVVVSDGHAGAGAGGTRRRRAVHAGARAAGRAGAGVRRPLPGRAAGASAVRRHRARSSTTASSICELARDVDLLLVSPDDLDDEVLPRGPPARAAERRAGRARACVVPGSVRRRGTGGRARSAVCAGFALAGVRAPRLVRPFGDPVPDGRVRRAAAWWPWPASRGRSGSSRRSSARLGRGRARWSSATTTGSPPPTWSAIDDGRRDAARAGGVLTTEKDAVRLTSLALPHRHVSRGPGGADAARRSSRPREFATGSRRACADGARAARTGGRELMAVSLKHGAVRRRGGAGRALSRGHRPDVDGRRAPVRRGRRPVGVHAVDAFHRDIALENLAHAFPSRTAGERRALRARRCSRTSAALLFELLKVGRLSQAELLRLIEFEGDERVAARLRAGQGRAASSPATSATGRCRPSPSRSCADPIVGAGAPARQSRPARSWLERIRTSTGNAVIYRQGAHPARCCASWPTTAAWRS